MVDPSHIDYNKPALHYQDRISAVKCHLMLHVFSPAKGGF